MPKILAIAEGLKVQVHPQLQSKLAAGSDA